MVTENRAQYADPVSMMRAGAMLLSHIGYANEAERLTRALDICVLHEKKFVITGRDTGATCERFTEYVKKTLQI
jgi:isocitrate dehydrogenase (NAD+)